VSVVACCHAEGSLMPAVSIGNGKTKTRIGKTRSLMEPKYSLLQSPDMST
jgi:hypothetical protein